MLPPSALFFARLLERKNQQCVCEAFDDIERVFKRHRERACGQGGVWCFFSSALTDRGSETGDLAHLERTLFPVEGPDGPILERCRVFYCDPYASWQKPRIEQAHTLLRRVLPKGTSFDGLRKERLVLSALI